MQSDLRGFGRLLFFLCFKLPSFPCGIAVENTISANDARLHLRKIEFCIEFLNETNANDYYHIIR